MEKFRIIFDYGFEKFKKDFDTLDEAKDFLKKFQPMDFCIATIFENGKEVDKYTSKHVGTEHLGYFEFEID